MSVTPVETTTETPVTGPVCSRCGCSSRVYTDGCATCSNRKRQHEYRARQREARSLQVPGLLYIVSSGSDVGLLVWRTGERCSARSIETMLQSMRSRVGDPDLDVMREIPCSMDAGYSLIEQADRITDEHNGRPVYLYDLGSIREQLDSLAPRPATPLLVSDGDGYRCEHSGRLYELTRAGDDWQLTADCSADVLSLARSRGRSGGSVRMALAWARVTIGAGWPRPAS